MLNQLITIYTSEFWMIMLAGALFFVCLPALRGEKRDLLPIRNVIRLIPVIPETVFAGKWYRIAGNEVSIILNTVQNRYLLWDCRHRLG